MEDFLYDAIIFDFDGVLVQSIDIKAAAFAAIYAPYGQEIVNKVVQYHHTHGGVSRYEKFKHFHNNLLGFSLSTEEMNNLDKQFSQCVMQKVINAPEIAGANAFLGYFSGLIACHVISATPHFELVDIIKMRNLSSYFISVHGAPEKKVDSINKIILDRGYEKKKVLMIGDALSDYHAAEAAHIKFLGVITHEMIFPDHVCVINDLTGLKELISGSVIHGDDGY